VAETGTSPYGVLTYFPFSIPLPNAPAFSNFTVTHSTSSETFAAHSDVFLVHSQSTAANETVHAVLAVYSDPKSYVKQQAVSVVLKMPVPQQGTLAPRVQAWDLPVAQTGRVGSYEIWEGELDLGVLISRHVVVETSRASVLLDISEIGN
jgi:hypothetical protein